MITEINMVGWCYWWLMDRYRCYSPYLLSLLENRLLV
jgi:hypothetical protein